MTPEKLTPTPEQEAIISATRAGGDSLMISARAGCSKTTTLQMAAPEVKVPALALAFGKRNADDLIPRLPPSFSVKTMNGLGFMALRRVSPHVQKWNLDDRKLGKLVSQVAKNRKMDLSGEQWDDLRRLVALAQQAGLVPNDAGERCLVPDNLSTWQELGARLWMSEEQSEFYHELAREVLLQDIELVEQGTISFDDQIWYSTCVKGSFIQYPLIMTDESQDLSPLNHLMVGLSLRRDARLIAVGDPKQAIFAFRGADEESMGSLRGLRPQWQELGLRTTFRCPKAIVARQLWHTPDYLAWHTNPEGEAHVLGGPGQDEAGRERIGRWTWAHVEARRPNPRSSVFVLCRNNAPLLGLAFKLIRSGVGCQMLGRDIGKGLLALSKKLMPQDELGAAACASALRDWKERELSLAIANDKGPETLDSIDDRAGCLEAVLDAGARDAGEMRALLDKLFSRNDGPVLSTIHKAKGMEADLVVHLDPWRIPSKAALRAEARGYSGPLKQEWNLKYVCETRTRHTLLEARLEDFEA